MFDDRIVVTHMAKNDTLRQDVCPIETDYDYPGNDLHVMTTRDIDTCVQMCKARVACKGVTWSYSVCKAKHNIETRVRLDESYNVQSVIFNCTSSHRHLPLFIASKHFDKF